MEPAKPEQNREEAGKEEQDPADFLRHSNAAEPSWFTELIWFLKENRRWWLFPIFIVLAFLTTIAIISGTGAAPFIYALF